MSRGKIEISQDVEQIVDPNDMQMVFYRIKLSSRPSRDFIARIYDFWNNHARHRNMNYKELFSDYERNLLIHTYLTADVGDAMALLQDALVSVNNRNY
jgi:hypothetical protein